MRKEKFVISCLQLIYSYFSDYFQEGEVDPSAFSPQKTADNALSVFPSGESPDGVDSDDDGDGDGDGDGYNDGGDGDGNDDDGDHGDDGKVSKLHQVFLLDTFF